MKQAFTNRLHTMWQTDSRRMFRTPLFYILLGISFAVPILILVMTSMSGGTSMTSIENAWQIIASDSSAGMMAMDMTSMCNINLIYFLTAVFVCLFVSEDFSSGYVKNLFTARVRKGDYVASKTIAGFLAGTLYLIAFFLGTVLGGSFAGLSFELGMAGAYGLVMSMLAKIFLMGVFSAIFVAMSVIGKKRTCFSLLLSLFAGMLLFMMVPMMTPLDSGVQNVFLCLAGGVLFAGGIGVISKHILNSTSLV